ncbi:hypothetical protein HN51_063172 [Arachis hypogaea]|uniref:uncharacterized protein LOC107619369 n=1 Tax=Arachis ipaensis TaxID=130454 RepID=UPI0007AF2B22|nr:uncharacterized protein LOC107619369 [Arachis ipaensis]XP_025629496.1 uncharacterized protein LOC112722616 [Arachis hypogaea]QHO20759.1 Adenine nucleotide alpha hydrolase superfamily protein [Arachis hypogaea]
MGLGRSRPRLRLRGLCFGNATPHVRASSASRAEFSSNDVHESSRDKADEIGLETGGNNRVMVVVDSSFEAKGALDWALSHTIQKQDNVILVHLAKPTNREDSNERKFNLKAYQLLLEMKNTCETKKPGVQVSVVMLEAEEKGAAIVQEAKQQSVSLLVVGQRKRSLVRRLMAKKWPWMRTRSEVVEYCIQNSPCMTIAVRRKNKKLGGYLISTKRHKNFWLLA